MAKRQGLDDIIRDAINAVTGGAVTTGRTRRTSPRGRAYRNKMMEKPKTANVDPFGRPYGFKKPDPSMPQDLKNIPYNERPASVSRRRLKERMKLAKGSAGERARNQRLREKYGK